ncbi:hypothetical protein BGZ88_005427 [Linnemannia elongata]|nr:hypothetical protein BGZ88_005427 [Linnemannia elongata]
MALFLGRLTADTRSRDLEDLFAKYGRVTRLDIKRGTNSGYGFVEYEDPRDADEAVHKLNGHMVNGNPIVVEFAKNNGRRAGDNECFKCGKEGNAQAYSDTGLEIAAEADVTAVAIAEGSVIIGGPVQECEDFLDFRLQRATRTPSMDLSRTVIFRQLFSADLTAHDPDPVTQSEPGLPDLSLIPEESRSPRRRSRSRSRSPRRDYDRDRYDRRDYDRRDRSPRRDYREDRRDDRREDRRDDRREDRGGRDERDEPHREDRGGRDEPRRGDEDRGRSRSRSRSPRQD